MNIDQETIRSVISGDRGAFELLINDHKRLVNHIVFRMIPNETDREDLCQDVFIRVYQKLAGFRFDCKLSSWIARIAYNRCLNHLQKKRVPLFEDHANEGQTVDSCADNSRRHDLDSESRDLARRVNEEIDTLPIRYGMVLTLYHLCDMGYAEIARITQQPEGTVKSHLFRARRILKEKLQAKYQMEELWQTGT